MRLKAITLLTLGLLSLQAPGQQPASNNGDLPDRFLVAYTLYQKGENLEGNRNFQAALAAYRDAMQTLDEIAKKDPTWNPSILEYRRKRIAEAITRLQSKTGGAPASNGGERASGGIPRNDLPTKGSDELIETLGNGIPGIPDAMPKATARPVKSSGGADPIAQLTEQIEALKSEAKNAREAGAKAQKETDDLKAKLSKATDEKNKSDEKLRILTQRSEIAEKELERTRGSRTADSEAVKVLKDQAAKLRRDIRELGIDRAAQEEVRVQTTSLIKSKMQQANDLKDKLIEANNRNEASQKALAEMQKKFDGVVKERDTLAVNLKAMTTERDKALVEVKQLRDSQKNVDKLMADNSALATKLSDAEKQIAQFKAEGAQKDIIITDLRKEVANVSKQLDDVKKESAAYQTKMADLQGRLVSTADQLALALKQQPGTGTEATKRMSDENRLLRDIVMRQMTEQARRDQTRKLVLSDMQKLEIKSKDLIQHINMLTEPVVKLTKEEAALFKKPVVEVDANEIKITVAKQGGTAAPEIAPTIDTPPPVAPPPVAPPVAATPAPAAIKPPVPTASPVKKTAGKASPASAKPPLTIATPEQKPALTLEQAPAKPGDMVSLEVKPPSNPKLTEVPSSPTPGGSEPRTAPAEDGKVTESGAGASTVPHDLQPTAQMAKDQFDRGNYRDAEKLYETILAKAPTNLYALSNLGVVRFRESKYKLAEESFRKAIAIAPEDAFSRCTLGIIYYTQQRYDDAVNELTKALAINPKYAAAHNFLGITASQKGWQEAAQKELETATALDPNYADAHFNLAVVYATQQPPSKENARHFYKLAIQLGAEADTSLEALLK